MCRRATAGCTGSSTATPGAEVHDDADAQYRARQVTPPQTGSGRRGVPQTQGQVPLGCDGARCHDRVLPGTALADRVRAARGVAVWQRMAPQAWRHGAVAARCMHGWPCGVLGMQALRPNG